MLTGVGTAATCSPPTATLAYDPLLRLYQVAGAATTRFAYDGADAIADYDGSNALQRRFVFGPGMQPLVQYDGSGTTTRKFLSTDERGSVIALTDSSGALIGINSYDEYGKPGAANTGRFQYTGQRWLSELGAYDYKARVYLPHLGSYAGMIGVGWLVVPSIIQLGPQMNIDKVRSQLIECGMNEISPNIFVPNVPKLLRWQRSRIRIISKNELFIAGPRLLLLEVESKLGNQSRG